jgi:RNA-splicing ligase RtcB
LYSSTRSSKPCSSGQVAWQASAYKGIERVMQLQEQAGLLTRVARMRPIAVLMAGEDGVD